MMRQLLDRNMLLLGLLLTICLCSRWGGAQDTCIGALMAYSQNTTDEAVLRRYLSRSYASCLEAEAVQPSTIKVAASTCAAVTAAMSSQEFPSSLAGHLLCYEVDTSRLMAEVLDELHSNMSDAASGWLLPPWGVDVLAAQQAVAPLSQVLSAALDNTDWEAQLLSGLPPYFKHLVTAGTSSVLFLPVDGSVQLLFHRADVLARSNWSAPSTWDELVDMAEHFNGTDLNEDGQPDWGFCLDGASDCLYSELLGAIAAPMLQQHGPSQGMLFDPETLNPRFNTSAFKHALALFTRLAKVSPPMQDSASQFTLEVTALSAAALQAAGNTAADIVMRRAEVDSVLRQSHCGPAGSGRFQAGRCAFTAGTGHIWKSAQAPVSTASAMLQQQARAQSQWYARGRMGVSMLPGTSTIWNHMSNQLVPCNASLCPYGRNGQPELQLSNPSNTHALEAYINRALYTPSMGTVAAVSSAASAAQQQAVAALWHASIQPDVHKQLALSFAEPTILPMYADLLDDHALPHFIAAGYHENDTLQYLQAVAATLQHPNLVPSPVLAGNMPLVRYVMDYAARQAVKGIQPAVLAQQMQQYIVRHVLWYNSDDLSQLQMGIDDSGIAGLPMDVLMSRLPSMSSTDMRATMRLSYRLAIGYWGYDTNTSSLDNQPVAAQDASIPTVSFVVPIVSAVIVLLLSVVYELRKRMDHHSLFGKVVAPGAAKETTLLVTDIESSTTLWELLPPHVMDVTLHHHHTCMRHVLLKHDGYESATEGDSFILAFHCPEDAVLFALECQVALMACPWPAELLACEQCAPFYVMQLETDRARLGGVGLLDEDMMLADRLQNSTTQHPDGQPAPNITVITEEDAHGPVQQYSTSGVGLASPMPQRSGSGPLDLPSFGMSAMTCDSMRPSAFRLGTAGLFSNDLSKRGAVSLSGLPNPMFDSSRDPIRMAAMVIARVGEAEESGQCAAQLPSERPTLGHSSMMTSQGGSRAAEHTISSIKGTTQGGTSTASSPMGERTFLSEVQSGWKAVSADTPNAVLLFRGLRVRMGMACANPTDADVTYNKAAARTHYGGELLLLAKAVSDAAPGAAILMNDMAHAQLPLESLWDKALIMDIGEYVLSDSLPPMTLFRMVGRRVMGRIAYLTVSRVQATISRGVLGAPLGNVAVAHVQLVGVQQLLAWNETLAEDAMDIFHEQAEMVMGRLRGGYLAEAQQDQITAVFALASEALVWAVTLQQDLLESDWPAELLEHELCEELIVNGQLVFRGPRCRVGVDSGRAVGDISPQTGRCVYQGRPVSRSLRVMQAATSNQVLCTHHAWQAANTANNVGLLACHHIMADRLGMFKLRGERLEKVELLQCKFGAAAFVNKQRAGSGFLTQEDVLDLHAFPTDTGPAMAHSPRIAAGVHGDMHGMHDGHVS